MTTSAEASLVSKTFKSRLRSDPSLGVSDLMKPFQKMFDHYGSRDVRKVLDAPPEMDWKSAPHVKWLCRQQVLFKSLLEIVPNTVVTSRKMKDALQRLHEEEPVNLRRKDDAVLWDYVDTKVRIGLAQLRELKNNRDYCFDRGMRKLSEPEKEVLRCMLEMVNFTEANNKAEDSTLTTPPSSGRHHDARPGHANDNLKTEKNTLALVPVTHGRSPTRQAAASATASTSSNPSFVKNVFESILNKGNTDDTTPSPKGGKKRKQEGLEDVFMASQSSEATTPDKREKKMPSVKRRLSFHDDRSEETTTQGKKATITILPAGQRILHEKKRKKQIEQKNRTSEDEVEQHAPVGVFDSLLDSLTVEEGTPEKNDDRGPSSSSKKKPKKPVKAVVEDESCSGGIHLDPVSRFLYVDAFFVFYNSRTVVVLTSSFTVVTVVDQVRFSCKCGLF